MGEDAETTTLHIKEMLQEWTSPSVSEKIFSQDAVSQVAKERKIMRYASKFS